jgi:inward rectifier potassium channel
LNDTTNKPPQADAATVGLAVAREGRRRRVAIVRGQDKGRWTDIYHVMLNMPWSVFLLTALAMFLALNAVFSMFYMADARGIANARPGNFWDTFLFSVGTIASANYSKLAPQSAYANGVFVFEAFVDYIYLAFLTSLIFARFSRPMSRVVFSNVAVVAPFDGVPTLMFRAANQRANSILDAEAKVTLARRRTTQEGIVMRRFEELKLVRERSSLFALSWTVMHRIDDNSPLSGLEQQALHDQDMEIIVLLSGTDETLADRIYARFSYSPEDVLWNRRFVDVLSRTASGRRVVDLNRFHDTYPVEQDETGS